ncbi:hypothetical protein [Streptoalloteichus tenebrarius]|uniref:hypothetical protein n=1 Tax=Streptoalloteichus tenebrarius (strain ATCC 17920 / DSM 40477 / JCM 4838 / CBS 697.72 / NBRC 16177 / NCIMB 11028 / NRRL B-12390 / A12253. 1 / ISP 5477) TaxID=1933 RepID=UPI0020A57F46|nr:hypothetical protein [Streptoalloteichus tenebrarius]
MELDVFSGRPNPRWELSPQESRRLADRLVGFDLPAPDDQGRLGFRQFIVSLSPGERYEGIPTRFALAVLPRRTPKQGAGWSQGQRVEVARWLLESARDVTDDVREHVVDALTEDQVRGCVTNPPAYNPGYWNDPSRIKKNNCYNYAANHASDTFAQPGRRSGQVFTKMECQDVAEAAVRDGLKASCVNKSRQVALVIWPGQDFHWYGHHSEGFWGHKPGQTQATNEDRDKLVIHDPQKCNRGPYTDFCGYLWVPPGQRVE